MLITVITADHYELARSQIQTIHKITDGIELRLDYWKNLNLDEVKKLRDEFSLPMIFTLRKKSQGGWYASDESARLDLLKRLCECQPDYLDLEYDLPNEFVQTIKTNFPKIKIICSYHDFKKTPKDPRRILAKMFAADIHKISTFAHSALDALRIMLFLKNNRDKNLAVMCMGEEGVVTRILGKIFGSKLIYAAFDSHTKVVPDQLTLDELRDTYHIHELDSDSKIYSLIGDPIDKSVGHLFHNAAYRFLKLNAVYVKLKINQDMLSDAIVYLKQLNFSGLSVTMPLKNAIVPHVELMPGEPEVVNTILKNWQGCNTDGAGAVKVLDENNLGKKKIIILGAGGTAQAIAWAAKKAGADIVIFNRSLNKAEEIAQAVKGEAYSLDKISEIKNIGYDYLINTLPIEVPVQLEDFIPHTTVMDCVYYPMETKFLKKAQAAGCKIIPGHNLYIEQAVLQIKTWIASPAKNADSQ